MSHTIKPCCLTPTPQTTNTMTKNEYKELERRAYTSKHNKTTAAQKSHIRRVVSNALEIAKTYRKCDTDLVITAALTHEMTPDQRSYIQTMFMWDDEKLLTLEAACQAVTHTGETYDRLEQRILHDAHRLEECGVIAAALRLSGIENIEEYTKTQTEFYDGYQTKLGAMMAKNRRYAAEAFDNALVKEMKETENRLNENLETTLKDEPIKNRLSLIKTGGGFRMDGYFVWCGSVIYDKGEYHMFASRWLERLKFPSGYMTGSEIVHATSKTPEGPYTYRATIISQRQRGYWDAQWAHNPQIVKCGDTFVLFYNGAPTAANSKVRQIGYATTKNLNSDKWQRCDKPIDLGREDCNNPAAWVDRDGSVLLAFRYGNQRIGIARARRYNAEYEILNPDILPEVIAEDPFLWRDSRTGMYRMIVEDGRGKLTGGIKYGAILESNDAIHWQPEDPPLAYDHTLMYDDLNMINAERRERPQLLIDKDGNITHLFTAVLYEGKTWNEAQPLVK